MPRTPLVLLLALATLPAAAAPPSPPPAGNWPSFRGPHAAGVADGQNLPDRWSAEEGVHLRWKTAIPGLAHSSPVVWGNHLFVTTAVAKNTSSEFKPGLYGDGTTASDRTAQHEYRVYCLDKRSGKILWQRTAFTGVPRSGRHIKSTYANPSPATDGRRVVVHFGSEGLYAYDFAGKLLWKKDLGVLTTSAYDVPDYEWGYASSPIFYRDSVIVQADTTGDDFLLALDAATGKERWRTVRQELPSWSTPNVYEGPTGPELVTNAPNFIRGYDPTTGREKWKLGGSSQITAPTPIFTEQFLVVSSGRRPGKPLFVLKPGASGEITLPEGKTSGEFVVWSREGRGSYMPTPIIYGPYLYSLNNDGVFDCYDLATGTEIYRERIPHHGSGFSASPVAADGKLYLASEDGDVFVLRTGPKFEVISKNPMGEVLMATPALSGGTMYVRGRSHVFAVGPDSPQKPKKAKTTKK